MHHRWSRKVHRVSMMRSSKNGVAVWRGTVRRVRVVLARCSLASLARCSPLLALFVAVSCDVYVDCFSSAPVSAVTGTDGPPNLVRSVFVSVVSLTVRRFVMNSFAYAVGL